MHKLLFLFALTIALVFTNCGSDDDGPGNNNCLADYNTDLAAANSAYNDAVTAFGNDQSAANCQALRDRANDIVNVVDNYQGCDAIDATIYQQSLDAARTAVNSISC